MNNKPCISCTKPLNGGVFRRLNECPHCAVLQSPLLSANGKPVPIEQAIAASRKARATQKPLVLDAKAQQSVIQKPVTQPVPKKKKRVDADQIEARKRALYAAKVKVLAARKAKALEARKAEALKSQATRAMVSKIDSKPVQLVKPVAPKSAKHSNNPFLVTSNEKNLKAKEADPKNVTSNPFLTALNKPNRENMACAYRRAAR